VDAGQVFEWPCRLRCTNPLTVATKVKDDGSIKRRLVLDLSRCVNLTLASDDFRMVTLQDAINATREGSFQLVFDLKSAFHHIRLHPSCYELMGFKVNREDGQVAYYCFIVLVFGLKVASQVLGRVLKPLCIFLIQNGVPVIVYIDDGLVVAPSKEKAERRFRFALEVLEKAGFLVSLEKSSKPGDAAKCIHFLGVEINSGAMCVSASADKIAKLREFIARIVKYGILCQ
jgi:hypothetical protein